MLVASLPFIGVEELTGLTLLLLLMGLWVASF